MARKVYIAGPYSSDPEGNTLNAIHACDHLLNLGYVPFCPHLTHYIDQVHSRPYEEWLDYDFEFVRICDVLLRLPGESEGADREVALAESLHIPVVYKINQLVLLQFDNVPKATVPDKPESMCEMHQRLFSTGAKRSADTDDFRFDLVSPLALREVARTCAEGATKYGDFNWERGMPVHDLLNHALNHINDFLGGKLETVELAHATWNLMAAIHSFLLWPELNKGHLRRPGCIPPLGE